MKASYVLGRAVFRALYPLYFRFRACHPERVPETGPVILASNHASLLEPPAVGIRLRRLVHFLARDTLFDSVWLGPLLRSWEAIPVDRERGGASGLKAVFEKLHAGGLVLLFIEGTRSRDGQLQPARSGVGLVAVKSGAPVVPVRVFGSFEAWGRHALWPRPRQIVVRYGLPMRFDALRAEAQDAPKPRQKEIYQAISDQVMAVIAGMGPGADRHEPASAFDAADGAELDDLV